MPDLSPCPFCGSADLYAGSSPELMRGKVISMARIICHGCGCTMENNDPQENTTDRRDELLAELIERWNTRA